MKVVVQCFVIVDLSQLWCVGIKSQCRLDVIVACSCLTASFVWEILCIIQGEAQKLLLGPLLFTFNFSSGSHSPVIRLCGVAVLLCYMVPDAVIFFSFLAN